jgi:hypothetical protein
MDPNGALAERLMGDNRRHAAAFGLGQLEASPSRKP